MKSAVGFDGARQDNVTVISRKFAGAAGADDAAPWYDAGWVPMVARNATAILIALLVLLLGVRPLVKALTRKEDETKTEAKESADGSDANTGSDDAPAIEVQPPVSLDQIANSRGFDERLGAVRGFTRDNPARAALAIRDMIKTEAKA